MDGPTYPATCFQNRYTAPGLDKTIRCRQPTDPGADNDDIDRKQVGHG